MRRTYRTLSFHTIRLVANFGRHTTERGQRTREVVESIALVTCEKMRLHFVKAISNFTMKEQ